MRAFIAARFAAMVSGIRVYWFFVADRGRSCTALGVGVKASSTSTANPFPIIKPRAAWIRDHHAVMKPGADWPEGI